MSAFNLQTSARPNILALKPYRCARDDYKDDGTNILLDANENAYGPGIDTEIEKEGLNGEASRGGVGVGTGVNGTSESVSASKNSGDFLKNNRLELKGLNRYPDPHQTELKTHLCNLRQTHTQKDAQSPLLTPSNLFVGVGSDEAIDALIRCFCVPGIDKILICPPTYGMYTVSASVNDVGISEVPLKNTNITADDESQDSFVLDTNSIAQKLTSDPKIKIIYLCSPGNPTGKLLPKESIEKVLAHPTYNGIVVLDEAYIDFAPYGSSMAECVTEHPNLVVMQTLSKAFGLAGIRLGSAFTSPEIASLLNNMKAPYNVSDPTSQIAIKALSSPKNLSIMQNNRTRILNQRQRLIKQLPQIPGIGKFKGGFDSNFLLVEILDKPVEKGGKADNDMAMRVYESLATEQGVVVRFRGKEFGCVGCLRVTVGTEVEVERFLGSLRKVLGFIFEEGVKGVVEEGREKEESGSIP